MHLSPNGQDPDRHLQLVMLQIVPINCILKLEGKQIAVLTCYRDAF